MNFNSIRKLLFTNRFFENIFLLFLRATIFPKAVHKFIAGNFLYPKHTLRTVKRNGIFYRLDISDYQAWLIYFLSEEDSSQKLLHYLGDSKTIIDVGGNIGQSSLEINKNRKYLYKDFKIISFEPYPETYQHFIHNLKLNSEIENITVENMGLGEAESEVKMFRECNSNSGGNKVVYDQSQNTTGIKTVRITTLDNYIESHKIEKVDFIKMDIEGYEYSALKGAEKTLRKFKPKLYLELDTHNLKKQGRSTAELLSFLKNLNYRIADVHHKYSEEELASIEVHTDIFCD
jgi:FkbM family methyltransferase